MKYVKTLALLLFFNMATYAQDMVEPEKVKREGLNPEPSPSNILILPYLSEFYDNENLEFDDHQLEHWALKTEQSTAVKQLGEGEKCVVNVYSSVYVLLSETQTTNKNYMIMDETID